MSDTPTPSPNLEQNRFRLDGKVVIVTGASSGIGKRFVHVLHGAGAIVVMAARRQDRLDELVTQYPGSVAIATDVADDDDLARLVNATMAQFGRIDVLINNAGTMANHPPESEPMNEWRAVMDVNLNGPFHLAQLCAKASMLEHGGVMVNVASVLGLVSSGRLEQASYAASKGAMVNLTRELACLWARRGVRVNALCPGWFASELTQDLMSVDAGMKFLRQRTPMGRVGREDEQTLVIDGGWAAQ
jgi:NAD(P)-dependent dehydrogenase (short-subunit alcohol dehydrogenase family)